MYYIRRQGRIKGPLTREKLRSLRAERRLRMRDEISESPDGPWLVLRDVRDSVLGSGKALPEFDVSLFEEQLGGGADVQPARDAEAADPSWHDAVRSWVEGESLIPDPWRPWKIALAAVLLVALAVLTAVSFLAHGGH